MKKITLTEFRKLTAAQVKSGPCLEITSDNETVALVVVGSEGDMRERIKGLSGLIDSGRGK